MLLYMPQPDIRNALDTVKGQSMSDHLLKTYLPDAHILLYNDLKNYRSIEELLPTNKSFCVLLYTNGNSGASIQGHWAALARHNNEILYFDSYGRPPDYPIDHWFKNNKAQQTKYLSALLDSTSLPVFYNGTAYQNSHADVSTCGRYVVFFIKHMQLGNSLDNFYMLMKKLKDKSKLSFDKLISYMVNNVESQ